MQPTTLQYGAGIKENGCTVSIRGVKMSFLRGVAQLAKVHDWG